MKNPEGLPKADPAKPSFGDVPAGRWSYDAIEWAFDAGIIQADDNGNFRPADPITRAEMAVILVKVEKLTDKAPDNTFSDIDDRLDHDDILKVARAKIFQGYPDGTFRPDNSATRYEVVAAMVRYLLGGEPTDEMWEDIDLPFTDTPRRHWGYRYAAMAVMGYRPLVP